MEEELPIYLHSLLGRYIGAEKEFPRHLGFYARDHLNPDERIQPLVDHDIDVSVWRR